MFVTKLPKTSRFCCVCYKLRGGFWRQGEINVARIERKNDREIYDDESERWNRCYRMLYKMMAGLDMSQECDRKNEVIR